MLGGDRHFIDRFRGNFEWPLVDVIFILNNERVLTLIAKNRLLIVLVAVLLVLSVAACSNNSSENDTPVKNSDGTEPNNAAVNQADDSGKSNISFDEKYDITLFQWGPRDIHEEDAIIRYINEKFNINLKVERILAKEYAKNLELKIAAGDMPDIFRYPLTSLHIYTNLYEDGYLMNFAEYADKYELDGLKAYMNREGTEEFAEKDGVFQLPSNKGKETPLMIVRQDWLDQLGLKHPTTWDEFKNMLQAFKDHSLGGDRTVPLTAAFGAQELHVISSMWTGANTWGNVDGKWIYESIMPEYKPYMEYISDLYKNGLIDKEIFTINETQAKAKFVSGASGLYLAGANRYTGLEKDVLEANPGAKLSVIIPKPAGPAGELSKVVGSYTEPVVAISKGRDEDFLARVAALLDFMHSDEGIQILNFGIESVHYNVVDGKTVKTEAFDRDFIPSLGHLTAMTTDYSLAASNQEGVLKDNFEYSAKVGIAPPFTEISYGEAKKVLPAVNKKFEEWTIKFLTGSKDVELDWEQYTKEMNEAGVAALTAAVEERAKSLSE